jgi:hypothetical protein
MKYILTIIVFANITLFGQDEIRKRQFFIGGFASPDLSYRLLLNNTGVNKTVADSRDSYEIPKFGYAAGLTTLFQINRSIALSLGIEYSNKGQRTKDLDLNFGNQIDPRRGGISPFVIEQPTTVQFYYRVSYLDIPFRIDYYISKKKVAPFISAGVSTNIFLGEKITSINTYEDGHKRKQGYPSNNLYNVINPQFQFGAGLDIVIKKSRLRIFPIYRISLSKVHTGLNQYFYSYGLGLNYLIGL